MAKNGEELEDMTAWHFDKGIPAMLILAIFVQAAVAVSVGSTMRSQIQYNTDDIDAIHANERQKDSTMLSSIQTQAVALARIDESLKNIHLQLDYLKNK